MHGNGGYFEDEKGVWCFRDKVAAVSFCFTERNERQKREDELGFVFLEREARSIVEREKEDENKCGGRGRPMAVEEKEKEDKKNGLCVLERERED